MKKSDVAMIVLIASIGVILAYFVAVNISFLKVPEKGTEVETVQKITSDVVKPSEDVFNKDAINPTVEVLVGSGGAN